MGEVIMNWLRRNPRVFGQQFVATTAWQLCLPRDNQRFAIILPSDPTGTVYYHLGLTVSEYPALAVPPNVGSVTLHEDVIGGLIIEPLWVKASAALPPWPFLALSYNNAEFAIYRRSVDDIISKSQSP